MSKGNMLLGYAKGKVGSLVFARRKGEQITRAYNAKPANPNTEAQVRQRTQISNLVSLYRTCKALLDHSFTDRKVGQSSYNAFVSANLNSVKIYLTKDAAKVNACVVAPYVISKGTLPPVQVSGVGANATTNIALGSLVIDENTTVGEFSQAVIDNNVSIVSGMQLTYVSLVQETNINTGFPIVNMRLYEVVINPSDARLLADFMPEQARAVRDGFLAHGELVADGGFCWIVSQKDSEGKTLSSTQRIVVTSQTTYIQWANSDAVNAATRSYNAVGEYFLTPAGSEVASGTSASSSIASVVLAGTTVSSNGQLKLSAGTVGITMRGSNLPEDGEYKVTVNGTVYALEELTSASATEVVSSFTVAQAVQVSNVQVSVNGVVLFRANPQQPAGGDNSEEYPME